LAKFLSLLANFYEFKSRFENGFFASTFWSTSPSL
jgi:hypothetical protein